MNIYRKTAVVVGILFIIGTVSGILSGVVTAPIMAGATFPLNIAASGIGRLMIPLALQEMVFAVWLIVKGFRPSVIASGTARTATNEVLSAA